MDYLKFVPKHLSASPRASLRHAVGSLALALLLCVALAVKSSDARSQSNAAGAPILVLQKGSISAMSLAFSPNDRFVATAGLDSVVKLWDVGVNPGKLLRNLEGSSTAITTALAFSNREAGDDRHEDGKWLAAGNFNGQVIVWDMSKGRVLCNYQKDLKMIYAVTFSPNNRWLAVGDADGQVRVFNAETCKPLPPLKGETSPIYALAYSGDGTRLAAIVGQNQLGGQQGEEGEAEEEAEVEYVDAPEKTSIKVWDTANWQQRPPLKSLDNATQLTFTPDGRLLNAAIKSYDEETKADEIKVSAWDGKDWSELPSQSLKAGKYSTLVFSRDGRRMSSLSQDLTEFGKSFLKIWETADWKESLTPLPPSAIPPMGAKVAFDADAKQLAITGFGDLRVIDLIEPNRSRMMPNVIQGVAKVAFSRNGRLLASVYEDGWVRVWDLAAGMALRSFPVKDSREMNLSLLTGGSVSLTFSPDDRFLFVGRIGRGGREGWSDPILKVFDALTGYESPLSSKFSGSDRAVFSPDGRWLLTGSRDHKLWEWTEDGLKQVKDWEGPSFQSFEASQSVVFSPDGRWLAVGGSNNDIHVSQMVDGRWEAREEALAGPGPFSDLSKLAFSSDNRLLLVGTRWASTPLKVEEVTSAPQWKEMPTFFDEYFDQVVAGPEGTLATVGANSMSRIRLWDIKAGREATPPLEGHVSVVTSVAFDPFNRWVASSSSDGTVRLWNPKTGKFVVSLVSFGLDKYWGTNTMAVAADGLFDGTAEAMRQADWRYSGDEDIFNVFSMNLFFDHFYYPGLLSEIYAGNVPRAPRDLAQRMQLPGLRLMMRQNLVRVRERGGRPVICFVDAPSFENLGIYVNGMQLRFTPASLKHAREDNDCPYRAEMPEGDKQIELVNLFKEEQAQAKPPWVGPKSEVSDATLHVLTVGVTKYPSASLYGDLPYAVSDAKEIEAFFAEQQASPRKPFKNIRIHPPLYNEEATLDFIRRRLADVAREVKANDVVFIYFSGHGAVPPGEAMFYFAPVDAHSLKLGATGFNSAMFAEALRNMPARRIVLVIDACQSGGVVESLGRMGDMKNSFEQRLSQRGAANSWPTGGAVAGVHIIASATPLQEALQPRELRKGVMAKVLIEALRVQSPSPEGKVWMKDVIDYINQHLTQTSIEASPQQSQRALIQSVGLDFPIAASPAPAGGR